MCFPRRSIGFEVCRPGHHPARGVCVCPGLCCDLRYTSVDSAQHTLEFCPAWARLRRGSHRGNRVGSLATGDSRGTVGEREREEGRDLLL